MKTQKEKIVRYTSEDLKHKKSRTDWEKVDALTDEDTDASPRLDAQWFKEAVWQGYTHQADEYKERITIRLDKEVLDFFRKKSKGYQGRINNVLRAFIKAQQNQL